MIIKSCFLIVLTLVTTDPSWAQNLDPSVSRKKPELPPIASAPIGHGPNRTWNVLHREYDHTFNLMDPATRREMADGYIDTYTLQPFVLSVDPSAQRMHMLDSSHHTQFEFDALEGRWRKLQIHPLPERPPSSGGDPRGRMLLGGDGKLYAHRGKVLYQHTPKGWIRLGDFTDRKLWPPQSHEVFHPFVVFDETRILITGGSEGIIQLLEKEGNLWKDRASEAYPSLPGRGHTHQSSADNAHYMVHGSRVYLYFPKTNYRMYVVDMDDRRIRELAVSWPTWDVARSQDYSYFRETPLTPQAMLFIAKTPDEILALAPMLNSQDAATVIHLGAGRIDRTETKQMSSLPHRIPYVMPNGDWIPYRDLGKKENK